MLRRTVQIEDNHNYTVMIGDVSGSKQLSGRHRYQTQLFLKSAIVQLNEEYQQDIDAPVTITKGDEFQALFRDLASAYKVSLAIEKIIFPIQIRFGFGVGRVYKMGGRLPIEMDGPAFHLANWAMGLAKKKKTQFIVNTDLEKFDILCNIIFRLITAIKQKWNERHYRLFWSYKELGTYRKVAEIENISPQAVWDALKNCRALDVKHAEESLMQYFNDFYSEFPESELKVSEPENASLR
jgi:hypothetical protein